MTTRVPDFGTDLKCDDDLTPEMFETSGFPLLAQDLVARLETPRGSLVDDENYGHDIRDDVSRALTPAEQAALPAVYAAELGADERVFQVKASVRLKTTDTIDVEFLAQSTLGPFRVVAGISNALAIVKEVTPL